MKIASWNVNSVKARLPHLLAFLEEAQPDVLCLQETKCPAADFPTLEAKGLGYHVETIGQRAYNGVALLSKRPAEELVCGLPGSEDDEQPPPETAIRRNAFSASSWVRNAAMRRAALSVTTIRRSSISLVLTAISLTLPARPAGAM